jgi:hypothetical protein
LESVLAQARCNGGAPVLLSLAGVGIYHHAVAGGYQFQFADPSVL